MSLKASSGLFVTLEGGEGSGKSSVAFHLQSLLNNDGRQTELTREPGGTALGETVRQLLLDPASKMGAQAETLLFLAARAQHLEETIRPALAQGTVVLCDRFNDSTIAYQGYGRGLPINAVTELCQLACGGTVPQLTLLLDVDPELGLERATRQSTHDRLEAEELAFHQRVRDGFHSLAKQFPERIRLIDASQPLEEVVQECYREIKWKPSLDRCSPGE